MTPRERLWSEYVAERPPAEHWTAEYGEWARAFPDWLAERLEAASAEVQNLRLRVRGYEAYFDRPRIQEAMSKDVEILDGIVRGEHHDKPFDA